MAVGAGSEQIDDGAEGMGSDEEWQEVMVAPDEEPELDQPLRELAGEEVVDDPEEVQDHRCIKVPTEPNPNEKAKHCCLHWPIRSWCRHCVTGRGKHDKHMRKRGEKEMPNIPFISIDYIFMGTDILLAKNNTMLVMFDNSSEAIWAYRTGSKRVPPWLAGAMLKDLEDAGYKNDRICLRSDQEKVIKKLKDEVIAARNALTVPQESPVRKSQCNGRMEQSIRVLEGQIRTYLCAFEDEAGIKIGPGSRAYGFF